MTDVLQRIKLAQKENDLLDLIREMKRLEGIINSPNVKSQTYKKQCRKKLEELMTKQTKLTDDITEAIFLDMEIK